MHKIEEENKKTNSGLVSSQLRSYQLCLVAKPLGGVRSQDFKGVQHLPAMSLSLQEQDKVLVIYSIRL